MENCSKEYVAAYLTNKSLLPSAKKIEKRGLYEIMWGTKPRNYEKRIKEGKY